MSLGFGLCHWPQGNAASGFTGILDGYGALAAWDIGHRLVGSYTGPAVRIRRLSDSDEHNFIPDNTLDTASIATFLSATSGVIVTLFDQAGSMDLGQATAANQPAYAASGFNSTPSMDFDGTDDYLTVSLGTELDGEANTYAHLVPALSDADDTTHRAWMSLGHSANNHYDYHRFDGTGAGWLKSERHFSGGDFANDFQSGAADANPNIWTTARSATALDTWRKTTQVRTAVAYDTTGNVDFDTFALGGAYINGAASMYWDGDIVGCALFSPRPSADDLTAIRDAYLSLKGL